MVRMRRRYARARKIRKITGQEGEKNGNKNRKKGADIILLKNGVPIASLFFFSSAPSETFRNDVNAEFNIYSR